ncbi:putative chlorophyll synthase [Helianthus annuus]|nr:putative chlorophyll synthase [Helianthus annuus]KAJ0685759.1 putative chlorophyll synthase [Helianthus annuus]KAJ0689634.1 putative chlorophyll synthase [Helianthus annuus]
MSTVRVLAVKQTIRRLIWRQSLWFHESDIWKIHVQLAKSVTSPPLIWGVVCGAVASGIFHWTMEDVAKLMVCMLMSGPFLSD